MVRNIKTALALAALTLTLGFGLHPTVYAQDSMKHENTAITLATGTFNGKVHSTSGRATIYQQEDGTWASKNIAEIGANIPVDISIAPNRIVISSQSPAFSSNILRALCNSSTRKMSRVYRMLRFTKSKIAHTSPILFFGRTP